MTRPLSPEPNPAADGGPPAPDGFDPAVVWSDALLAAALLAVDPIGLGGANLRTLAGPVRDAWLESLTACLPRETPVRRVPLGTPDGRLLGGLDLAATLEAGRPVMERGLLAEVGGGGLPGVVMMAMAERLTGDTAGKLAAALDHQEVVLERDGMANRSPCRIAVVALDEGLEADERPPEALLDRLAFAIDLQSMPPRLPDLLAGESRPVDRRQVEAARSRLTSVDLSDTHLEGLCGTATALGIASIRPVLLAVRAARAAAAIAGRASVTRQDAALAVRLVLAPRATAWPAADETPSDEDIPAETADPSDGDSGQDNNKGDGGDGDTGSTEDALLEDVLLAAAAAVIPPDLLARLQAGAATPRGVASAGKAGARTSGGRRGRPAGIRRGRPDRGARLNLVETLRAAAPWQPLRRAAVPEGTVDAGRVLVRSDDFRVTRFKQRSRTVTVFLVDASGSSALHRLAEAKGAVELLLADCYVRRDEVALIAFRGAGAELVLPPTRSLVRAKRSLAGLPGGGGTPLAAGLDMAATLVDAVVRKGATPVLVVLTDGRANVARPRPDGRAAGRDEAAADAAEAARALRQTGLSSVLIDTAPRPQARAQDLAADLGARYVPLPHADAAALSQVVAAK